MSHPELNRQPLNSQEQAPEADPELVAPTRRRYSQGYKQRILAEAEHCQRGELGVMLRREGLYYATLSKWRKQQADGKLDGRERAARREAAAQAKELKRLQQENARLKAELTKAETIIAVQKKLSALLEAVDD